MFAMISWKNLNTLAAYDKLAATKGKVNLAEAMGGRMQANSPDGKRLVVTVQL